MLASSNMDSIREEAEECWIEDGEGFASLDKERFVNLVRESYQYITKPEDTIFYSEDGDAVRFSYEILAEQAVLHGDLDFFREIINSDYSICNHNYFFPAVAKTKRFVFVDTLLLAGDSRVENYLHGTREEIATIITCFEHIFTVREMFLMEVKYFPLSLETAGAFLDKGIPLEEVLANCSERARRGLLKEDV